MDNQSAAGFGGWIIAGLLLVALVSQCGKDRPNATGGNGLLAAGSTSGEPSALSRWMYVQVDTLNCRASPDASSAKVEAIGGNAGLPPNAG